MPATRFLCDGETYEIAEVLKKAAGFNNFCGLPYPLLCLVAKHAQHVHSPLSVTTVLGCLRRAYFQKIMNYSVNPVWMLQVSYGTILNDYL
jgi:hypothetical protein